MSNIYSWKLLDDKAEGNIAHRLKQIKRTSAFKEITDKKYSYSNMVTYRNYQVQWLLLNSHS